MSPHASNIRPTKAKRIPNRKVEEIPTTCYDFSLINLLLWVGLNIPISTRHYMLLIGTTRKKTPGNELRSPYLKSRTYCNEI